MGSGDLVQEVQEVVRGPGVREAFRRTGDQVVGRRSGPGSGGWVFRELSGGQGPGGR